MTASDVFKTKNEWLYEIAVEAGLSRTARDQYVAFMKIRFPDERFKSYAKEWAQRYNTGRPEAYADNESLEAIEKARQEVTK